MVHIIHNNTLMNNRAGNNFELWLLLWSWIKIETWQSGKGQTVMLSIMTQLPQ